MTKPRVSAFYGTKYDRDYQVVVVEDACAAADRPEHEESMKLLGLIASVVKVEDLATL